jgi:glycosyltransferase involved in cell wall biosynthesis
MRIAYFTDTYTPEVNGVTNTLSRLGAYLDEKRIRHAVFTPAYEDGETFPRVENRHFTYRNLFRFKGLKTSLSPESRLAFPAFWEIDRICDNFKPDLVHVSTELGIGFRGMRYAVTRNLPLVMSYHTNYGKYLPVLNLRNLRTFFVFSRQRRRILGAKKGPPVRWYPGGPVYGVSTLHGL